MITKADIVGTLPYLERADLEAVHTLASHLLASGGPAGVPNATASPLGALCFEAISGALNTTLPHAGFMVTNTAKALEARISDLKSFLDTDFVGWDKNRVGQRAFLRMMMELIRDDLVGKGVRPTIGIVVKNIHRMPQIFDDAFPDYRQARKTNWVLQSFMSGR